MVILPTNFNGDMCNFSTSTKESFGIRLVPSRILLEDFD